MDQGPLVTQQIDAGARFVREFATYTPVRVAFWLKGAEDDQWFLYVAGDQIDDSNFDIAYGEVIRITAKMPDPWLDPFQIKVIGAHEPLAKAVLEIQEKYPGRLPTRYHGRQLGGLSVEEVYIYSPEFAVQ
jgi:hypothetical protein